MTLQNFEKHQPDHELKKGHDYFRTGHVNRLKETAPGEWEARVRGRETYEVTVILEGDHIDEVDCDCLHDIAYCKHVIAVLYALKERLGLPAAPPAAKDNTATTTISIKHLPEELLRGFLANYSEIDKGFGKMIEAYVMAEEGEREKVLYEMRIRHAATAVAEKTGGIGEQSLPQFIRPVDALLKMAEQAIQEKNYNRVTDLLLAVIETVPELIPSMEQSNRYRPEYCVQKGFALLEKMYAAGIPAALKERLSIKAHQEYIKAKYKKIYLQDSWLFLMKGPVADTVAIRAGQAGKTVAGMEKAAAGTAKAVAGTAKIVNMGSVARQSGNGGTIPTGNGRVMPTGNGETRQEIPKDKETARELMDEAYEELEIGRPGNDYSSLAAFFPQELLDLYADKLSAYADNNIGNESYAVIIRTLKKMQGWSGGAAFVKELAGELIRANRRRPPLVDALKKLL